MPSSRPCRRTGVRTIGFFRQKSPLLGVKAEFFTLRVCPCQGWPFRRNYRPNFSLPGKITSRGSFAMGRLLVVALLVVAASGCGWGPYTPVVAPQPVVVCHQNPALLPGIDHHCVWETVVDVVDDYFKVVHETPVRQVGSVLTEGRLETAPQVSPTVFEPWRPDVAGRHEVVENTLQSMRRRAIVRVMPGEGGYWVEVAVLKELEDVVRPEHATAGAATFRYDDTLRRVVNPVMAVEVTEGWIPQGRDTALEQKIIAQLHSRFGPSAGRAFSQRR